MSALISVYTDPDVVKAWKASVKALGTTQGPAMEEALLMWMDSKKEEIQRVMTPPTRDKVAS